MNIGIPNEFYLDFSNYKENNSIKKELTKLKKRERKNFLKILEEDQGVLYEKLYKKINTDKNDSKMLKTSTNSIIGYNWNCFSDKNSKYKRPSRWYFRFKVWK